MAKQYWSAERINENLRKIDEGGFSLPTTTRRIQEGRTNIIISNELRDAGYIRTYEESIDFMKRMYGDKFQGYSLVEYERDIKDLQDALGRERSYQGAVRAQRSRLMDIITDASEYVGELSINTRKYTTKQLYDAVKKANSMVKDSNAKSPQFYEYLCDILEGGSIW